MGVRRQQAVLQIVAPSTAALDQAWQMLLAQSVVDAAELHLEGHGLLFTARRDAAGAWIPSPAGAAA